MLSLGRQKRSCVALSPSSDPDSADAKRAFDAKNQMKGIGIAAIEVARGG
jgi:hypothetical protein